MGVGFANRWTYYIGADGTVLKIDKETNPATAGRDLVQTMNDLGFLSIKSRPLRPGPAAGQPISENPVAGLLPGFYIWQPKLFR